MRRRAATALCGALVVGIACTAQLDTSHAPTSAEARSPSPSPSPQQLPAADQSSFDPDNPVIPGFVPRAVLFRDEARGIIGGRVRCPRKCEGVGNGVLAVTSNGGATWLVTGRYTAPITKLTAIPGTETIWATASRCDYFFVGCGRALISSSDAGLTWRTHPTWVVNPSFATTAVGFGAGAGIRDDNAQLIATTHDGGTTWLPRRGPCGGWQNMAVGFSFPTPTHGWAACASAEPGAGFFQHKAVFATDDGGGTWQRMASFSPTHHQGKGLWANGGALGIQMFADGSGYFWAGGGDSNYLVRTDDGGRVWRTVWDESGGGRELSDISWLDAERGFAIVWRSWFGWTLSRTGDGGRRWATIVRWPTRQRNAES